MHSLVHDCIFFLCQSSLCSAYCDIWYQVYFFFKFYWQWKWDLKIFVLSTTVFLYVPLKCAFSRQFFSHLICRIFSLILTWIGFLQMESEMGLFMEFHWRALLGTPLLRCEESRIGQRGKMLQYSCKSDFSSATVFLEHSLVWRQGCRVLYTHPYTSKKELFWEWMQLWDLSSWRPISWEIKCLMP